MQASVATTGTPHRQAICSGVASKTPNAIGRDTGAQVVTLAPSVGGAKGAPVSDYIQLFDYDVKTLVAAFQATGMKGGA